MRCLGVMNVVYRVQTRQRVIYKASYGIHRFELAVNFAGKKHESDDFCIHINGYVSVHQATEYIFR